MSGAPGPPRSVQPAGQPHGPRLAWALGLAAVTLFGAIALMLAPLEPGVLALQFAATPHAFGAVVHAWGEDGVARYRAHLPWDFALLVAYGAFGWVLAHRTALFAGWRARERRLAAALLPAAALADAVENLLHLWLTAAPRFDAAEVYALAAAAAGLKWCALLAFALCVAAVLARRAPRG